MEKPDTPFPRHWAYYIALKILVIALGVGLAVYIFGFLF
jgi:hypothetical protein